MPTTKLSLQDLSLQGKQVLMRVDFNVPLSPQGEIVDDARIRATLPSIRWILDHGGSIVLMSHLGRPKGKKDPKLSLAPCAKRLSLLLQQEVKMIDDCLKTPQSPLKKGEIFLLENLRFYAAEETPSLDPSFAKQLSLWGEVYVNDAFGAAHRNHSSICPITAFFPHLAAAGLLMQKEIDSLSRLLTSPHHPFYVIIGGSKVSTKIGTLKALLKKADALFVGGAMAFTFLKAQGKVIGDSPYEQEHLEDIQNLFQLQIPIYLPQDLVITDPSLQNASIKTVDIDQGIPDGYRGMDIGKKTIASWQKQLQKGKTFFWNGPMGVFENPAFQQGTCAIASTLASMKGCTTIVGGGDSIAAIATFKLEKYFTHLSTGGGASLEFLEFGHLPGIDALSDK